jgi:hypothetical protein
MVFGQLELDVMLLHRYYSVREPANAICQVNDNLKYEEEMSGFGYLVFSLPAPSQSFAHLVYLLPKSWFLSHSLLKVLANSLSRQSATFSVAKGRRPGGSLHLLFRGTAS